jgi:nucleoid DNA-binding protein
MTKLTKTNLLADIRRRTFFTEKQFKAVAHSFFYLLTANAKTSKVKITGLGTFATIITKQRKGRNLRNNTLCIIEERTKMAFKPSRILKQEILAQYEGSSEDGAVANEG